MMESAAAIESRVRVERCVRRAVLRATAMRVAESSLLGASVAFVALGAARFSGGDGLESANVAAASIAGLAAALTWWIEKRPNRARIASVVDRELGHDGAFVTASELALRGELNLLEKLLVERAAKSVTARDVARAVPPPSIAFAALLAFAAAGFFWVRETKLAPSVVDSRRSNAIASGAASPGDANAEGSPDRAASELLHFEQRLAWASEPSRDPSSALEAALDVERGLAKLEDRERASDSLARRSETVRAEARRLAEKLSASKNGAGEASSSDSAVGGLAKDASDSTMARLRTTDESRASVDRPAAIAAGETSSAPNSEAGALGGRWWSVRHDAVVAQWVDACRSRAARNESHTKPQRD